MRRIFLFLCVLALAFKIQAQRPKVGLVLSGGGAKGFAHVGVLEILDSLGIPVDMVAGTSIGAVVGGLYAIGHKPRSIRNIIESADWDDLISSEPKRLYRPYLERNRHDRYILKLKLQENKVLVPSGFVNGQKVYTKLSHLTQGFHGEIDFLKLPRQFVCIATELNTGRERVLTSGILTDAMRASMAIPSIFMPFNLNGTYMIDGGVVNNFPADKLVELGADIIIGIDVQTTIGDTIKRPTLARILEKTGMYINFQTTAEREAHCDLIIRPDMTGLGVPDFDKNKLIIRRGREEARNQMEALKKIAEIFKNYPPDSVPEYQPFPDTIFVNKIRHPGREKVDKATIKGVLGVKPENPVSISGLEKNINFLYGTDFFDQVSYHIFLEADSNDYTLEIRVREAESDGILGLGLRYDIDFGIGILLNYTRRNVVFKGSVLSADAVMGETPRFSFDYYFNKGKFPGLGISTRAIFSNYDFYAMNSYQGKSSHDDVQTKLYWQATSHNNFNYGGFIEHHYTSQSFSGLPSFRESLFDNNYIRPFLYHLNLGIFFRSDFLNKNVYPTSGRSNTTEIRLVNNTYASYRSGTEASFLNIKFNYLWAYAATENISVQPRMGGVFSFFNQATLPYMAFLGGMGENYFNNQIPMVGFRYRELGTAGTIEDPRQLFRDNALLVGLDVQWEWRKNMYLVAMTNIAGVGGRPSSLYADPEWHLGYGLKVGYSTMAGPLELAIHRSTATGSLLGFFNFGFWF
ncbi:MAG: patatin-like phospholipase family protein [Cryomorphaceae bacterium]|nr:patatin-like phospholipase family protein [Cryomorphaceae bacterium]